VQINQIYIPDLVDELEISQDSLTTPNVETIESLAFFELEEFKKHREEGAPEVLKTSNPDDWSEISKTFLYRGKRADALAKLLRIRRNSPGTQTA